MKGASGGLMGLGISRLRACGYLWNWVKLKPRVYECTPCLFTFCVNCTGYAGFIKYMKAHLIHGSIHTKSC